MERVLKKKFEYEVSRRPELSRLIERLDTFDDSELMALPYIKWIRQALVIMKAEQRSERRTAAAMSRLVIVDGMQAEPVGQVLRWIGGDSYISRGKAQFSMRDGDLVLLPNTGGVWFSSIFSKIVDQKLITFSQLVSENVGYAEYRDMIQAEFNRRYAGDSLPVIFSQGTDDPRAARHMSVLAHGVTIGRV